MLVDKQNPPSDVEIIIKRINSKNNKLERILPDPLTTPKDEILIKDSTATAYEIKKAGAQSEKHRENRVKQLSDHNTLGMDRGGWGG